MISPSSVLIGVASLDVVIDAFHPGGGSADANAKPSGIWTCTFVVFASSVSFGTRTFSTANAPSGMTLGWTVTWAPAVAGRARARAPAVMMRLRFMVFLS